MSFVLVDAPSITAALISSGAPQPVQIVVAGVSTGQAVTVSSVVGSSRSSVPGGVVPAAPSGQIVLVDNRAPLNAEVYYEAVIDGETYISNSVRVDHPASQVIQSLDGRSVVDFEWVDNGVPREYSLHAAAFDVAGRPSPVVRFAQGGVGGGELTLLTSPANTAALQGLLLDGRPVVVRTDGQVRDLDAVQIVLPRTARSALFDGLMNDGSWSWRQWALTYLHVDDPEPSTALAAFTWDDFDAAMVGRTWDDFDALFSVSTWDQLDTYDWSQL